MWSYKSKESGKIYRRSEGLAVASLEMFKAGYFSSDQSNPCQVDSAGLRKLDLSLLAKGLQSSEGNPLAGLEGRAGLMSRLSEALRNTSYFGREGRPGNMLGMQSLVPGKNRRLTRSRLPPLTPNHSSSRYSHYHSSDPLVRPDQQPLQCLALNSNHYRRRSPRRCMALFLHAPVTTLFTMGERRAFPQAHPVALLFPHDPHDQDSKSALCRN